MEKCLFCKIIAGEISSTKVYEDKQFVSFRDIKPKARTHILTVPRKHIANLDDATEAERDLLGDMFLVCKKLAEQEGIKGRYKTVMNIGELAGQTVFHMHVHLLGGWESKDEVVSELRQ